MPPLEAAPAPPAHASAMPASPSAPPAEVEAPTPADTDAGTLPAVSQPGGGAAVAFLEALPAESLEGLHLPLSYRLATPVAGGAEASAQRAAESLPAHTSMMACTPFYKPVSRCVGGRG